MTYLHFYLYVHYRVKINPFISNVKILNILLTDYNVNVYCNPILKNNIAKKKGKKMSCYLSSWLHDMPLFISIGIRFLDISVENISGSIVSLEFQRYTIYYFLNR